MSTFSHEDYQGTQEIVSNQDVVFEADRDQTGAGDLIFRTGGVERARILHDGSGSGWGDVLGGASAFVKAGTISDADFTSPADGREGVNTAANEFVYRSGGSWYKARGSSGYFIAPSSAPSFLKASADKVCDGTADDVEINAAIAVAPAGATVRCGGGSFNLSSRINAKDFVSLKGVGQAVTTFVAGTGVASGVIVGQSGDTINDLTISDLTIDAGYSGGVGTISGVQVTSGARVKVRRVTVKNCGGSGILLQTGTVDSLIEACRIEDVGLNVAGTAHGITITGASHRNKIIRNWILGSRGMGVSVGAAGSGSTDCEITGNYIDQVSSVNKEAIGVTADNLRTIITDNHCLNGQDNGISCTAADSVIADNVIDTCLHHGISVGGNDCTVTGNRIRNPNGSSSTFAGIGLDTCTNCTVTGNRIKDDRGGSALMAYGIKEITNGGHNYSNNRITGAVTSTYLLSGSTSKIHDSGLVALTYGVTVNTDAANGTTFKLTVTDGVAFTIAAPTNPTQGCRITYDLLNSSGGAMGAVTWNAAFKLAGSFTNPASTKRRTISFYYDGTNWIEQNRAAADI